MIINNAKPAAFTAAKNLIHDEIYSIITWSRYDWEQKYKFLENGEIDERDARERYSFIRLTTRKVPTILPDNPLYKHAINSKMNLERALKKATIQELSAELFRLSHHLSMGKRNTIISSVINDFYEDLGGWPVDIIVEACRRYRNDPTNSFFPTPGKLKATMEKEFNERVEYSRRIKLLLSA